MDLQTTIIIIVTISFLAIVSVKEVGVLKKITAFILGAGAVVFIIFGLALLFALPTMWLWDYTMPYLFKVPEITLGRAFCLVLLAKILFGSSSSKSKD